MVKSNIILSKNLNIQNFEVKVKYSKATDTCLVNITYPEKLSSVIPELTRYLDNYFSSYKFSPNINDMSFGFTFTKEELDKMLKNKSTINTKLENSKNAVLKGISQKPVVVSDDWGISITKTIISIDDNILPSSVNKEDFKVAHINGDKKPRTVVDAYTSDEMGNKSTEPTAFISIELLLHPDEGTPIEFHGQNVFSDPFLMEVKFEGNLKSEKGTTYNEFDVEQKIEVTKTMICEQCKGWEINIKGYESEQGPISYSLYRPPKKTHKCALLIFSHGFAEWGNDPYVNLLNNKTTALASKTLQDTFDGAFILIPQRNSMQMLPSSLAELIRYIIKSNPEIDEDRVLIGGNSMGGGFTLRMIGLYPELFAAAFPVCAGAMSETYLPKVKNMPIWITHARNDGAVPIAQSELFVEQLKRIGNTQWHTSFFDDVHDTTGRFFDKEGNPYQYNGHWSWIYFFNDECYDEKLINCWEWLAEQVRKK